MDHPTRRKRTLLLWQPSPDEAEGRSQCALRPGQILSGRYTVIREIGRGGMGAVYESRDTKVELQVAIKVLDPALASDRRAITRFQREALAAGRIGQENICDVRDRGMTDEGLPYIVMELLQGQSLIDVMVREGRVAPGRAARIMGKVLSALAAAHAAGIIHRDLKPDNVFLSRTGDGEERVKLLDFGISKFLDDTAGPQLTKTGTVVGTPWYMSPEQAVGRKDIDHRSDIWSAGVVLYEAVTGSLPFDSANYSQLLLQILNRTPPPPSVHEPSLPEALEALIMKAMTKDRKARYQDAASMATDLQLAEAGIREYFPISGSAEK